MVLWWTSPVLLQDCSVLLRTKLDVCAFVLPKEMKVYQSVLEAEKPLESMLKAKVLGSVQMCMPWAMVLFSM